MKYIEIFDENKLKILKLIYKCRDDVCGCNLVEDLNLPKNLISYHIKTLKEAGILEDTKCGRRKFYKIKKNKFNDVKQILKAVHLI